MAVLHYNYVQPDEIGKPGGGVSVYLNNLVRGLLARGEEVILLSAGDRYSVLKRGVRLIVEPGTPSRAIVLNSPVLGPFYFNFDHIETYRTSTALDHIPSLLRAEFGEIETFHFHNVEGLTAGFFRHLRSSFPESKILFSAHNYNIVCPQVNLWRQEQYLCTDFRDGAMCTTCRIESDHHQRALAIKRARTILKVQTSKLGRVVYYMLNSLVLMVIPASRYIPRMGRRENTSEYIGNRNAQFYLMYRETNINLCQSVFDTILAVSNRTKEVLIRSGIPPSKVDVSYIGTKHFEHFIESKKIESIGRGLHLAYLGYMRADKGFYFLLDCLEALPENYAGKISVTIAATANDVDATRRIKQLSRKFRTVRYFNGFTHSVLDDVLHGVNLGVVPVLWEDNLPQVAIEIVSRGIPILTSDRGGAREIACSEAFTFDAGSIDDFNRAVVSISQGDIPLGEFWHYGVRLTSINEHVDELIRNYY